LPFLYPVTVNIIPSIKRNAAITDELIASRMKNWKKNPNGNMVIRRDPSGNI
jgi:hypothetical protein